MNIVIVYGAPMSGKTSYVNEQLTNIDIVYDYDAIAQAITNSAYQQYNDNAHELLLNIRNTMIDYAKWNDEGTMYIITTFLSKYIVNRLKTLSLNADFNKMDTDINTCLKRLYESDRHDAQEVEQTIRDWYARYDNKPASDRVVDKETMRFYKSKAWRDTREQVLKRDNYECQHCKAQGKVTTIDKSKHKSLDVDHIQELETHPDLAHDMDNLVTLCIACHNRKHNRSYNRWKKKPNKWDNDEAW